LKDKIESLENQVNSLQDRIRDLETTRDNSKYPQKGTLEAPDDTKTIQQSDSTLKPNIGSYSLENHTQINPSLQQVKEPISKGVSEVSKSPLKALSERQHYDTTFNPKKAQNGPRFITPSQISEEEQIEIIQLGFQRKAEGKISSFKKYYESTDPYSLFQLKGYSIKYESIRHTELSKKFKEKFLEK